MTSYRPNRVCRVVLNPAHGPFPVSADDNRRPLLLPTAARKQRSATWRIHCVRIFGAHISFFEPYIELWDMSWDCLLLQSVPRLAIRSELSNANSEIIIKPWSGRSTESGSTAYRRDSSRLPWPTTSRRRRIGRRRWLTTAACLGSPYHKSWEGHTSTCCQTQHLTLPALTYPLQG